MGDLVAIFRRERDCAFVVDADVMFIGVSDGAVKLKRGADCIEAAAAEARLHCRNHRRM